MAIRRITARRQDVRATGLLLFGLLAGCSPQPAADPDSVLTGFATAYAAAWSGPGLVPC